LSDTTYEGALINTCAAGHGAFLTTESVGAIIASRADDRPDSEEDAAIAAQGPQAIKDITETPRACPECGDEMAKMNFAYESGGDRRLVQQARPVGRCRRAQPHAGLG